MNNIFEKKKLNFCVFVLLTRRERVEKKILQISQPVQFNKKFSKIPIQRADRMQQPAKCDVTLFGRQYYNSQPGSIIKWNK